jgi:hypothetical protein
METTKEKERKKKKGLLNKLRRHPQNFLSFGISPSEFPAKL